MSNASFYNLPAFYLLSVIYQNIWHCCIMPGFITCQLLLLLSVSDKKILSWSIMDVFITGILLIQWKLTIKTIYNALDASFYYLPSFVTVEP